MLYDQTLSKSIIENESILNQSFSAEKGVLALSAQNSSENLNPNESRQRKVDFNFESI